MVRHVTLASGPYDLPASSKKPENDSNSYPALKTAYSVRTSLSRSTWFAQEWDGVQNIAHPELVIAAHLVLQAMRSTIEGTVNMADCSAQNGCHRLRADCASYPITLPGLSEYLHESSREATLFFFQEIVHHLKLYAEPNLPGPMVIRKIRTRWTPYSGLRHSTFEKLSGWQRTR
ncbi:hypothetical protein LTR09_012366 [Extremus antarcticus]|uniref:Uncharacterized protein n=1 Tax=Extremus antarcticus TaxID=702011 RepID=A0AAJ0G3V0_9PEZI|nr:hypothetical protein LTR09_012366 [Extremus antarcticus]